MPKSLQTVPAVNNIATTMMALYSDLWKFGIPLLRLLHK
jgi:hypothetical protein